MKIKIFLTSLVIMLTVCPAFAATDGGNGIIGATATTSTCYGDPLKYQSTERKSGTITYSAQWEKCTDCAATHASCELSVVDNECTYTTNCLTGYGNIQNDGKYNASCSANIYTITYEMNGGTNYVGAPTTYTYAVGTTINGIPTKTNKVFAGWCTDAALTFCAMTQTISTTDTGNKKFYAKWSDCAACNAGANCTCEFTGIVGNECQYNTGADDGYSVTSGADTNAPQCVGNTINLNWEGNGGTAPDPDANTCIYGGNISIPTTLPTREGYRFTGWKVTQWTE